MGTIPLPIPWADFHRAGHPPTFAAGQPDPCPLCVTHHLSPGRNDVTETGDIRDLLQALPNHHGGNGYMMQDLFTVRHDLIRRLSPPPRSVFEFGALLGYFLVTALDAAPTITRVGWVDLELHTADSNRLCAENLDAAGFSVLAMPENGVYWRHRDDMPTGLQFDLVAVDSDHSYQGCLDDLRAAAALEPRWLMIDDWTASGHTDDIQRATREWIEEQNELGVQWVVSEYVTANGLALLTRENVTVRDLVNANLWVAIEDDARTRDDVAEAYAARIKVAGGSSGDWAEFNEAIIERWSHSGLAYVKEHAWAIVAAA